MHTEHVFLVGAGGHGKVVLDALLLIGVRLANISVNDSKQALAGTDFLGIPIAVPEIHPEAQQGHFHVAIGNATVRQRIHAKLESLGSRALAVIHPAALVSRFAHLDAGVFVAAGAIIAPAARLGRAAIVNHGAVVDHDCQVGEFSHVAPNATLGGGVTIGSRVLVGAGANILPGISIGDDVIIGAGAVVAADVPSGTCMVGVPAREFSRGVHDEDF